MLGSKAPAFHICPLLTAGSLRSASADGEKTLLRRMISIARLPAYPLRLRLQKPTRPYILQKLSYLSRHYTMEVQPEAPPSPSASGKRPSETDADPVGAKRVRLDTETDREITPNDHPSESIPESSTDAPKSSQRGGKSKSKRGRGEPKDHRRGTRTEDAERQNNDEPKAPRLPKRACALLIGFSGAGYNGMQ